jgi:hypothetical protein
MACIGTPVQHRRGTIGAADEQRILWKSFDTWESSALAICFAMGASLNSGSEMRVDRRLSRHRPRCAYISNEGADAQASLEPLGREMGEQLGATGLDCPEYAHA